ncbi:MAG: LacI family DNA-binding transcriptional regulator [Corynebacterium humireducens]|jgi:DNA-binding LacI/PurR family transcriptional regulator|uniref:Transcriptional regulator, LacI family protein n=2 Tax=Corynebacterium humireducens TaxID=1223514 RepID=A0A0B5D5H8_9CORY|nr:LacI family DNA-binding transcriptional regulator [Corynebacterium humireducens]AJE34056.1 transcriptional regulator, LacI family protein [Corynebacterium humireducens NBRC 106098 = DSM 45392]NLA56883.1 LacI family DNA-binding transcriptional regulator [Corynebacterium humireducens]
MVKRARTLASLAAELGVSRTTVSNAYNQPDQLSAELRERILRAAAERGYPGPDPMARSLRTRRAGSIGVLLTEHLSYAFEDAASVDFLAGMAEATSGTESSLTLIPAGPSEQDASALVGRAVVDGIVVYSVAEGDPHLAAARARGIPLVVCDQPKGLPLPFVGIDDREAIKPAARALLDAGHTRIGILAIRLERTRRDGHVDTRTLPTAALHVQRARVLGALEELAGVGDVPVVTRHINDHANCLSAAEELLTSHPELTAVLCTTDSMALGVLEYAAAHGIAVPEDLSVTGFDGIRTALLRGLTTVVQPNKEKGRAAGRLLLELIDAPPTGDVPREILGTTFHAGSTVSAPRARRTP